MTIRGAESLCQGDINIGFGHACPCSSPALPRRRPGHPDGPREPAARPGRREGQRALSGLRGLARGSCATARTCARPPNANSPRKPASTVPRCTWNSSRPMAPPTAIPAAAWSASRTWPSRLTCPFPLPAETPGAPAGPRLTKSGPPWPSTTPISSTTPSSAPAPGWSTPPWPPPSAVPPSPSATCARSTKSSGTPARSPQLQPQGRPHRGFRRAHGHQARTRHRPSRRPLPARPGQYPRPAAAAQRHDRSPGRHRPAAGPATARTERKRSGRNRQAWPRGQPRVVPYGCHDKVASGREL